MIATHRPTWLLHLALAFAAVVGGVRAGASFGDRMASPVRVMSAGMITPQGAVQSLSANHDAPIGRASTRLASTSHAAWQRGSRRTQRTETSQLPGAERAQGAAVGTTRTRRIGAPLSARLDRVRLNGRLRAAPTRAPPKDG